MASGRGLLLLLLSAAALAGVASAAGPFLSGERERVPAQLFLADPLAFPLRSCIS